MPDATFWAILALVVGIPLVCGVWMFNRMVALGARADNAWSDIDVQLRKRWDLVPRLVETVAGYAAHERRTLEEVTEARAGATGAASTEEHARAESRLNEGFARLLAVAEAYPTLKADQLFRSLHDQLIDVEDDLESARRYYNAVTRDFNTLIGQFPASLVARATGRKGRTFFEITDLRAAGVPLVKFGGSEG
ncbi:MAG: LemA family protein [Phycisphaeraceae bacterium]|nr:LemA family protein [Phycisphaeraceae bacterium]